MDLTSDVRKTIQNSKHLKTYKNKTYSKRVTYIIRELVENYAAHPQYIDDVDWIFMPLVNPDGYEFAHTVVIQLISH